MHRNACRRSRVHSTATKRPLSCVSFSPVAVCSFYNLLEQDTRATAVILVGGTCRTHTWASQPLYVLYIGTDTPLSALCSPRRHSPRAPSERQRHLRQNPRTNYKNNNKTNTKRTAAYVPPPARIFYLSSSLPSPSSYHSNEGRHQCPTSPPLEFPSRLRNRSLALLALSYTV